MKRTLETAFEVSGLTFECQLIVDYSMSHRCMGGNGPEFDVGKVEITQAWEIDRDGTASPALGVQRMLIIDHLAHDRTAHEHIINLLAEQYARIQPDID